MCGHDAGSQEWQGHGQDGQRESVRMTRDTFRTKRLAAGQQPFTEDIRMTSMDREGEDSV
ncbi:hypothetical protein B6S09_00440 [Oceanimonas baumannii]|uniref:Uncharacterized protein n=1 Tax=Oceanimonas baumannii TaxID=129578 RepID=A0A235CNE5_9GAMM|nr:hypothetical protein B6S09_00440 [Oceanimonas baumannii]